MEPIVNRFECSAGELENTILPWLRNRVFHVTSAKGYTGIRTRRQIKNNKDGQFEFTSGQSKVSHGRLSGCVCLFDLRETSDKNIEDSLIKYNFLNPSFCKDNPFFLLISEKMYPKLISWKEARKEKIYNRILVPYIECWYPGGISIENVTEVIEVKVQRNEGPLTEMILEAWDT